MTNREWLATLSNEDFVNWIYAEQSIFYDHRTLEVIGKAVYYPTLTEVTMGWNSFSGRLLQWLDEERKTNMKTAKGNKMITFNELLERAETEEIVIHTPTEKQAITLLKALEKRGYEWTGGERLIDTVCYEDFEQDTCYVFGCYNLGLSKAVRYDSLDFYRDEGYTIIECGDIDFQEE